MPAIQIPNVVIIALQIIIAFVAAFALALWVSLIIWTFRDVRRRSRDVFAVLLATLMVVVFGPLGLLLYFLLRPPDTLAELYERSLEEEALLQDLTERPRCTGCSRLVEPDWVVCPDCHTRLKKICHHCGYKLHLRWTVCAACGTHVGRSVTTREHLPERHLPAGVEPSRLGLDEPEPIEPEVELDQPASETVFSNQ
jgi:RNA polymerase subunit RPABC4/transcription elongation factor Spt4